MSSHRQVRGMVLPALALVVSFILPFQAGGQTPPGPTLGQGEVTANDVYVRSGPSTNHYTVCKLDAGQRVTLLGDQGDWYRIRPPASTFSLISGDYVDTTDHKTGIVNGDNVRVRAGSLLNDNKYTVQKHLSKGAEVTILGREPDGFLRIDPPAGTSLWISRKYVEPVPDLLLALETGAGAGATDVSRRPDGSPTTSSIAHSTNAKPVELSASVLAGIERTPLRVKLEQLDSAAREELAKPVAERQFGPLIEQLRPVAQQDDDELAQRYAGVRLEQLTDMAKLVETVTALRKLGDEADATRRRFLNGRAKIRETLPPIPMGLDVQGELRRSALYPAGSLPNRYRLIDTSDSMERTIGYVEVPPGSNIVIDDFLGRYVGVRASTTRLQAGGVNPVPIFVVGELVDLQAPATTSESSDSDG